MNESLDLLAHSLGLFGCLVESFGRPFELSKDQDQAEPWKKEPDLRGHLVELSKVHSKRQVWDRTGSCKRWGLEGPVPGELSM